MKTNSYKVSAIALLTLGMFGFGLSACSKKAEETKPAETAAPTETAATNATAPVDTATTNTTAAAPAVAEVSEADKAALAKLGAPYASADLANGKRQFALCKTCHSLAAGAPNMTGPNMHGLVGRKSASVTGFAYSDAMKAAGKTWDLATIDAYVKNPKAYIPGNKMAFAGVPSDANRRDVIAYIAIESAK